jgi:ATP-dependent DNA helicase PIF1
MRVTRVLKMHCYKTTPAPFLFCRRTEFELIDQVMRDVMGVNEFMGGHPCVFAGDQRQILPVTKQNSLAAALTNDIKRSPLFRNFTVFRLTAPMRNAADAEYSRAIDDIGNGIAAGPLSPDSRGSEHFVYVPDGVDVWDASNEENLTRLQKFVHPNLERGEESTAEAARCAIASPFNAVVDQHNAACLARFPGRAIDLNATHELPPELSDVAALATEEHLASIKTSGVPNAELTLKVGCLAMCMRNLLPQLGIQNGTLVKILKISDYVIQVQTLPTEPGVRPVKASIPRILFTMKTGTLTFFRRQFPLRLAYARTINKMQGATITRLGLDLRNAVFSHGQLYVALSRVKTRNDVKILASFPPHGERITLHNIVYRSLLEGGMSGRRPPELRQIRVPQLLIAERLEMSSASNASFEGSDAALARDDESDSYADVGCMTESDTCRSDADSVCSISTDTASCSVTGSRRQRRSRHRPVTIARRAAVARPAPAATAARPLSRTRAEPTTELRSPSGAAVPEEHRMTHSWFYSPLACAVVGRHHRHISRIRERMGREQWESIVAAYTAALQRDYPDLLAEKTEEIRSLHGRAPHVRTRTQNQLFRLCEPYRAFDDTLDIDSACVLFITQNLQWGKRLEEL